MVRILKWIVPGGIVLALSVALTRGFGPEGALERLGSEYPWVVFGAVALLAGYFHRSRVAVLALGLAGLQIVFTQGTGGSAGVVLMGGILALVMGLLALSQDRGVFSSAGLLQFMALVGMFSFGWLFLVVAPEDITSFLAGAPLPGWVASWSALPQPVFLAFALALPTALSTGALRDGPVERGVFWSLVLVALALYSSADPGSVGVFLTGAGLTLGLSVMETSYAMAYKDDLTGLPARRALMRDLEGIGGTYSTAMVDVDHFKKFNDRYGHDVGDQVLRMVAARLAESSGGGRAYRYGGEEFTLLFPGKSVQEALPHLREARRSVEEAAFTLRGWRRPRKKPVDPGAWRGTGKQLPKRLSVTVSMGVADSTGNDPSPESVLKKADQALYRAKKAGRNRVAK